MNSAFLLVVVCLLSVAEQGISTLTYSCNPSGTVTVNNPDTSTFKGAFAQTADGSQNCTVYYIRGFGVFTLSDCPTSTNISLWLFNATTLPTILTGQNMEYHVIRCQQIPASGVYRKVTDKSWVTNQISTSMMPSVTPRIMLQTQLEDIESGIERTTAIVGEPLLWDIEGPVGYIILPLNCTVTSGAGDAAVVLVINGCSQDTYLLEHFEYPTATEKHILQAELYAFRFAGSEEIIIECDMLGCVNTSTVCDFTCSERKRRNVFDDNFPGLMERRSAGQQAAQALDFSDDQTIQPSDIVGHVRTTLRVFDVELSSSTPSNLASWTNGILLIVTYLGA